MYDQTAARAEAIGAPQGGQRFPEGASPLDRFLARAAERRTEQETHPHRYTGPWVNPDPGAITALTGSLHPVTALLDDGKQTKNHISNSKYRIRYALAALDGKSREDITWEDVMSYPWHHVTADMAREYRNNIHRLHANPHTRQGAIQILRSLLGRCRRANLMSIEALARVQDQLPTRGYRGPARHARRITPAELAALIAATDQSDPYLAARDTAVFTLMASTGMRVSEAVGLDLADWNHSEETLALRDTKNGRDRIVPVDPRVALRLSVWLIHRGSAPGPLFQSIRSDGYLTTKAIQQRLQVLAERAGIGLVHTHDFRRTVATTLLRTHDAPLVGRLLGHASLASTLTYDLADQDHQRDAISSLPLPEIEVLSLDRKATDEQT